MVDCGITLKICLSKAQEGGCRLPPVFLQVDEGACQLDQPFIECAIGLAPLRQPKRFKNFMRFVKKLLIEAIEETHVLGVRAALTQGIDRRCVSGAFRCHISFLLIEDQSPKSKMR